MPGAGDRQSTRAEVCVRWARGERELHGAFTVRENVFYGEQGVPRQEDLDGRDEDALHVVALQPGGERVIATLRLLFDGDVAKIGRVAVEAPWRHRGIASRMLALALEAARERGSGEVRLASQLLATELYARAGFRVVSDPFEEAGIPHVWMALALAGSDPTA